MVLAKGTEQWSTLSAHDSLPQTKFSRKIHHTSALARSACQQREVCGARGEGRTVGNIIAQLITKLRGSCRQKAVLPTFLPNKAVSLGSGRMGSAETPTTLGTLVGGSRDACASPRASRSPRFPIARAGGCTAKSWYLSWREITLALVRSATGCQPTTCPPAAPRARGRSPVLLGDQQLSGGCPWGEQNVLAGVCSLSGNAFGQKGRARAWGGEIPTGSFLEAWFRVGTFLFFGREPLCYASSCCKGSYPTGGMGSVGS